MDENARKAIVGIGASVSGLSALEEVFQTLPGTSGMTFVVVPRPELTSTNRLIEVIRRHTSMRVAHAAADMPLTPNTVYVSPTDKYVALRDDRIELVESGDERFPVDFFYRSLARSHGEQAIGIILAGSGSDGALGVREIRCGGGMVIAQEPKSAELDIMPRYAINTGMVDLVLPPAEMAGMLMSFTNLRSADPSVESPIDRERVDRLNEVYELLADRPDKGYNAANLYRYVSRRMRIAAIDDLAGYCEYLKQSPVELKELTKDLAACVTSFFHDSEALKRLADTALGPLVGEDRGAQPIRVWIPRCSTGEEVYSIAMLLLEQASAAGTKIPMQIFASNVDPEVLNIARAGVYPENIALDVAPERLERFFTKTNGGYHVSKRIRELITFALHRIASDPPFYRLDLISCRDVLGCFEPHLQRQIADRFAFALKPGGYLFLGRDAAAAGSLLDFEFQTLSPEIGLYVRTATPASSVLKRIASAAPGSSFKSAINEDLHQSQPSMLGLFNRELKFTANAAEDFQLANEEITSVNEELQAASEELAASKEEIQASNEELIVLNDQLTAKIEELNLLNDDLNNFFNASDIATVFIDTDGCIKRFTPLACKLFSFAFTDIGRPLEHIANKLLVRNISNICQKVIEDLAPIEQETQTADGEWYQMRCLPYRTASNRIDGAVLNFIDISPRKQAEIDLKSLNKDLESRVAERIGALHLLQAITVSANNATNINEVLQFALDETCAHMQWPVGHAYLFDPSTYALFSSGLWHVTEAQKYRAFRRALEGFRFGPGDGLPGEVLANRQALWISNIGEHPANQQIRVAMRAGFKSTLLIPVLVQADVPAVLEFLAAETRQPNERLLEVMEQIGMQIGRVFERKRAEAQLKEQERLAAIGISTAKMAHEINNPLSNIYAAVQFLEQELLRQQEPAGHETLSMISDVKKEVARLTRLMDDLRTFLITGRQDPKFEPINVAAIVRELLRVEEPALSQHNIRLVQEVPKVLPPVLGDTNRLKQVLVNLTRNAMEAMLEGGTLTVRGYPAGNEVVLEVVDTGQGIPEHLNVLEQPITTKRQGVGIGLLIVRQIVAEHGGTVHYATKPARGTTFRVTLPRVL